MPTAMRTVVETPAVQAKAAIDASLSHNSVLAAAVNPGRKP
jgi:hypothetical protein